MKNFLRWKPGSRWTIKDFLRLLVCTVIALLLSLYVLLPYLKNQMANSMKLDDLLDKDFTKGMPSPNALIASSARSSSAPFVNFVKAKEPERSASDVAIVDNWFKRSGYGSQGVAMYETYSDDVLEDLISKGDIRAMDVMGTRKLMSDGLKAAIPYVEMGIVYGSRGAINTMVAYIGPKGGGTTYSYDESKKMLKESFAYMSLLVLRGDSFRGHERASSLRSFERDYHIKNPLTAEDEIWIQNRAKELYDHYQGERYRLGLGDFDNEVPKEVRIFFEGK